MSNRVVSTDWQDRVRRPPKSRAGSIRRSPPVVRKFGMRHRSLSSAGLAVFAMLAVLTLGACGSGSSGGGSPGGGTGAFTLEAAQFGRPIFDVDGDLVDVVAPASLYEVDPLTGVPLEGFPKPLTPTIDLSQLVSFNFEQILDPITPQVPVVPRNAVVVLQFSVSVGAESLKTDQTDPDDPGLLTSASPIKVVRKDGSLVPTIALVEGKRVILLPITSQTAGWPSSPLVFDSQGQVVEDPTGTLRIVTNDSLLPLQSKNGLVLEPRADKLGTNNKPLPFNPGNSELDAIKLQTDNSLVGFNGFLPDLAAPRIIRGLEIDGEITSITQGLFEGQSVVQLHDATLSDVPNTTANGGDGEWAGGLLEVTSAGGMVTRYVVEANILNDVTPFEPIFQLEPGIDLASIVAVGDTYTLRRTEFYEPVPPPLPTNPFALAQVTVDPENRPRDPNDPADAVNHDLRYFLQVLDEDGEPRTDVWNPADDLFASIPPKSKIALRFSEPMDIATFDAYESFYVTSAANAKTDPSFRDMRIGCTRSALDNTQILFEPFLENQFDPDESALIGFGGNASNLKLVIRTRPSQAQIDGILENANQEALAKITDLDEVGVLGVSDLGGRGLGLPAALLNQGDATNFLLNDSSPGRSPFGPAVDFEVTFQTKSTADPTYGAIVHRFMGQPTSASFQPPAGEVFDTVTQGVEFFDFPPETDAAGDVVRRYVYGPSIFDIGLNIPGRLAGASAVAIQHIVDDFNKPAPSSWASPTGEDFLITLGFGNSTPITANNGARFQHVYRAGDASPSYFDFQGVTLDLVGLAWSPFPPDGTTPVNPTQLDNFELLVGLSGINAGRGPNTNQGAGIPNQKNSGLNEQFDANLLDWAENTCEIENFSVKLREAYDKGQPPLTPVVKETTPYVISPNALVNPANAVGPSNTFNQYLPFPNFNAGFDPFFGKDDVFSVPYDSEFPMLLEYRMKSNETPAAQNTFRFSPGILTSALPRFRIWSLGQDPLAHGVPNWTLGGQQNNSWRAGEGGPLLEPGAPEGGIPGLPHPTLPGGGVPDEIDLANPVVGVQFTSPPNGPWGNGQPPIPSDPDNAYQPLPVEEWEYVLPPVFSCAPFASFQPVTDYDNGNFNNGELPMPNSNPDMNWYWANGMFDTAPVQQPLPDLACYPGPAGQPPTSWYGYGSFPAGTIPPCVPFSYPSYQLKPNEFGDNARYYMMWNYRKRVSIIESPTLLAVPANGQVRYLRPIVEPPLSTVDPEAGANVEFRAGKELDFAIASLESGYVSYDDPDLPSKLTGFDQENVYLKFRATLGVAPGQTQGPTIDTVVIPYEKLD